MWVFFAVQAIFIIWIVAGVGGNSHSMNQGVTAADRAQAQQACDNCPAVPLAGQVNRLRRAAAYIYLWAAAFTERRRQAREDLALGIYRDKDGTPHFGKRRSR